MKLYKLMSRKWAEQLVLAGSLRIGTLFDYGDTEKYGEAIGDTQEGFRETYSKISGEKRGDELNALESRFIHFANDSAARTARIGGGIKFVLAHPKQNLYLLSTMMRDSLEAQAKINEENDRAGRELYDTCVEITNAVGFTRILDSFMMKHADARKLANGPCTYADQRIDFNQPAPHALLHPAMVKKLDHSYQNEYRILYQDNDLTKKIEPINIKLMELTRYVRIFR